MRHIWIRGDSQIIDARPPTASCFSSDRTLYTGLAGRLPVCDVVNLHWVADFLDYGAFFPRLQKSLPIVWTLHDMNPFTGGCHYDEGCGRYLSRCGACPQIRSRGEHDLSAEIWARKAGALKHIDAARLRVVGSSRWLVDVAARSSLFNRFPVSMIPLGLDTGIFRPQGRLRARQALGIGPEAKVLMFAAATVTNPLKGLSVLLTALAGLAEIKGLTLLSAGAGDPPVPQGIRHVRLGRVDNDQRLALAYCAADVFVIPSLQEAFGQTALEAMACGTPVVGFDVGGIPDIVRPGKTGLLAPAGDASALRNAIAKVLENEALRRAMGETCRRVAEEEFSIELMARRYERLYQELRDLSARNMVLERAGDNGAASPTPGVLSNH